MTCPNCDVDIRAAISTGNTHFESTFAKKLVIAEQIAVAVAGLVVANRFEELFRVPRFSESPVARIAPSLPVGG